MKKLIPCMLAGLIITGLFALCITSFLAPSSDYIQDTLEPTEEPFYFVDNPDSVKLYSNDQLFLSASTNRPDCEYFWEYKTPYSFTWLSAVDGIDMDGYYYLPYLMYVSSPILVYRCKAVYNDMITYSAPCLVNVIPTKGIDKSEELDELEVLEKFDHFETSEVIEEKTESEVIE